MEYTQNYKLKKPGQEDFYNVDDFNSNADIIDQKLKEIVDDLASHKNDKAAHIDYAIADGTDTYTVEIPGITAYVEGMSLKIKFQNANTGPSTLNINGLGDIAIKKSNGNDLSAGYIKSGRVYHLVYDGVNFQLLGEGGEYGTAQPEHVLEGYTIGTENGIVQGTMPNQGQKIITPSTVNIAIPRGFHDGTGYVVGSPNLIPANIKKGVDIFGIIGTLETQITVQPVSFSTTLTVPKRTSPGADAHTFDTTIITLPSDFKMFIYKSNSFSSSGVIMSAPYASSSNASGVGLRFGNYIVGSATLDGDQQKSWFDLILAIRLPDGRTKYLVTHTDPDYNSRDSFSDYYSSFIPAGDFPSASINWANPVITIHSRIYDDLSGPTSFKITFNGILYIIQ